MFIWYKNSAIASIVSIIGCVAAFCGIAWIWKGEIGTWQGILLIICGIGIAILGKRISERKEKKKQEEARKEKQNGYTGSTRTSQNADSKANRPQGAGNTERTAGSAAQEKPRFCPKCGARLLQDAVFCSTCGAQISPPSTAGASQATGNTQTAQTAQRKEKNKAALEELFTKATEYAAKGDYQKELETLRSGLAIDDGDAALLNKIGRSYRRLGDYQTALDYYYQSAAADPNDPTIGMNIATAYTFMEKYEQAEKIFAAEIAKLEAANTPEDKGVLKTAYANYAHCVGKSGDLNKAKDLLVKAKNAGYEKCDTIWNQLLNG